MYYLHIYNSEKEEGSIVLPFEDMQPMFRAMNTGCITRMMFYLLPERKIQYPAVYQKY